MRRRRLLIAACLFLGCVTPRFRSNPFDLPDWIRHGTGADVAEDQRYFSGVGLASYLKSDKLRRLTAAANARTDLARLMTRYVRALFGHVSEELARDAPPSNGESVCIAEDRVPDFVQKQFDNVTITDEWIWPDDDAKQGAARARISFEVFRAALLKIEMSPKERALVEAKADAEFDEFVRTYRR